MKYNPQIHHRRSIRLKGYDYSLEGAYYITICCHDRKHFFGKVENGRMKLNAFGKIAHETWEQLPTRFTNIELDVFQIMPNHIHGIIVIVNVLKASLAGAQKIIVGDIIGAYKSIVANDCLALWKSKRPNETMGKLWQRNYYEHIVRNEQSLNNIRNYIIQNPENWEKDSENI